MIFLNKIKEINRWFSTTFKSNDKKFAEFLEIHKNLLDKCQKGDILEI